ncbi:hypothetical protein GCM10010123_29080 [Pilimelia anulata]|uniref:Uncharacterized protein n=1 Tax=Pilimelia anulata TaxID=53371 RepID=A0A8J3FAH8_9ACTN|nr:hypothetical protein [Pilimelia anulata]GGJ97255.1 hypothetical protein GCM10010123_29080 [Pilimelia anulata]
MSQDLWGEYVAATQELDLVQRAAGEAGSAAPDAVRNELDALRDRLVTQRTRLVSAGLTAELAPVPAEAHAAAEAVGADPGRALTALRRAAALADAADALLAPAALAGPAAPAGPGAWQRNLLVYGPFAAVAFVVNLVLYAVGGTPASALALVWMTGMALLAYGLGWLVVGLIAGVGPAVRTLDRTPLVGAAACALPLLFALAGLA